MVNFHVPNDSLELRPDEHEQPYMMRHTAMYLKYKLTLN